MIPVLTEPPIVMDPRDRADGRLCRKCGLRVARAGRNDCQACRTAEVRTIAAARATAHGKPRQCHRCHAPLLTVAAAVYRKSIPYCPMCVDLCRNYPCGNARSATYKTVCVDCGRRRSNGYAGVKNCRQCGVEIQRGIGKGIVNCATCSAALVVSARERRNAANRAAYKAKLCACGNVRARKARWCPACRVRRDVLAARRYAAAQKEKRRAKLYGVRNNFKPVEWRQLLEFFGRRCAYCGRAAQKLEKDHVQPISRGGDHAADNIVPACRSCNASKNDRSLLDWLLAGGPRIVEGETLAWR